ncbi:MAG: hypothetical protein NT027_13450 [Proteobacteria bacterium]|nr:hypothetical protein [Pseudomonadota bacterium]
MDFRDRHPDVKFWKGHSLDRFQYVYPYERIPTGGLYELLAFDDSTTFLVLTGDLSKDESTITSYAIEAPRSCLIRKMFERGELSWTDFFSHRNWLIEFNSMLFTDLPTPSKYIHPSNINIAIQQRLQILDLEGSPHKIYHDQIVRAWAYQLYYGVDASESEEEYEMFLTRSAKFLSAHVIAEGLAYVEKHKQNAAVSAGSNCLMKKSNLAV